MTKRILSVLGVLALAALPAFGQSKTVREMSRIEGQGVSTLQGLGLVLGLPGTGDSAKELAIARPIAEMLRRNGNPIPSLDELAKGRSVALVMVTCEVPREGAKVDDQLDARVSVIHSASSLEGGELYISPLTPPMPGSPVWAFAQGPVIVQNIETPTTGIVPDGAYIFREIDTTPDITDSFSLILDRAYADHRAASEIAAVINDEYLLTTRAIGLKIARVLDERTIRVTVPLSERPDPAGFVGDVMSARVSVARLGVAPTVHCDSKAGIIVVTGDVRVSPAVITHKNLVISTTLPPPEPTPEDPIVETGRWTSVTTEFDERQLARLGDLQASLERLDVPVQDQIQILKKLHDSGKLHARLIVD